MKRYVMVLVVLIGVLVGLGRAPEAKAGIFTANGEVTYKEYWMPHSQFTGGCTDAGLPEDPNGSWYVEPGVLNKCPKMMQINIPDNFSGALKAEVYLDLWRNYDSHSAHFRVGNNPTVYTPDTGSDWSRSPWVGEIPLSSLQQTTTFTFWAEHGLYHIHDIAVRIYYDDTHPLLVNGSPATAPDGELTIIKSLDDNVEVPANTGGLLLVNKDQLTLRAQFAPGSGAKYVEFHAYYDGYDDDNDGVSRDWHNIGRNNWWPGGYDASTHPNGGTINHIGTAAVLAAGGTISKDWNLRYIINQPGVKFKIRIVATDGNVREGPATPEYTLARYYPTVYYTIPGFTDIGLHMSGTQADTVAVTFPLPADYSPIDYSAAYLLGMYWKRPKFSFNGTSPAYISEGAAADEWELGVRTLNKTVLLPGNNSLAYFYTTGIGQFVEEPGPMIVLKGNSTDAPDIAPPYVASRLPAPNSVDVDVFTNITIQFRDLGTGVNRDSIIMSVNGNKVTPVFSGTANNLSVSYVPTQPLPANTQIPVTFYGCDLLGNCMTTADVFSFTTEPPDLTPPQITNINVVTTDSQATVTWTTNEAASSKVEYGLTQALEKPLVSDDNLVLKHSLVLPGLQTESTYYYRLTSVDYNNNAGTTTILTFKTKRTPGALISDDFSACELDSSVWSYLNPLGDAPMVLTGTGAQIAVPAGTGHDLWRSNLDAPRLMQYVANQDFDVKVKFEKPLAQKTKSIGLLVQQDAANYLRIGFQSENSNVISLVVANTVSGNSTVVFTTPVGITAPSYLRVNRTGDIWNIQYSTDGTNWTLATDYVRAMVMSQIGPYVGNTGTDPAHVNVIDYFISQSDPIAVEDPPIELNVTKVGQGTVTRDPDKASYGCNETVTLTAAPAPDWAFQGWSGALSGGELVKTINLTKSENVTATFTNSTLYTVNVNVTSNGDGVGGTVTKSPDAAGYVYGTNVTLTATPTPGWSFVGWSGGYTGTDPVAVVSVTGNMNITATFDQDEYTLDTLIITEGVGLGGTITVEPVQPTYLYGEAVTITVTPELGWTFTGWEGEGVSGTDPVLHLSMSQNVVAIARLVQNQYDLTVDIVSNSEVGQVGGVVTKDPDQPTYGHGQVVTLQAAPANGWVFDGWGGDLTGTELTTTVEMVSDKSITAEFTQQHYTVTATAQGAGHVNVTPVKEYYLYGDIVTLTPVPDSGMEFVIWTGDISNDVAPAVVVMEGNLTVEAVFGIDTTPIEISNPDVEVLPGGTTARVTWTTDVPGTSQVDYGEDVDYLGGTVTKDALVTAHEVILTGLSPETFYHYKLTSVDGFGHLVESDDLSFSTSASSGIFSDDFAACEVDSRWTWVNPLDEDNVQLSLRGDQIAITVPGGDATAPAHNVWTTGIDAPRLMQPSNDTDFTVEAKFDSAIEGFLAMQGILIQQDEDTFLRFEFHARQANEINVYAVTIDGDQAKPRKTTVVPIADSSASVPMYMRIVRTGAKWEQWYKMGQAGEWVKSVDFEFAVEVNQVGVYAGNTRFKGNLPTHTAVVDYFFNTASPITAEDSRYTINVDITGSGAVTRNPNQGYYCGQQVTLRAVPAAGWIFRGWTGDATGSNPVRTVTVAGDINLTAEFVASSEGYKLVVPVILR